MDLEELKKYGIEDFYIQKLKEMGISQLYPPQEEAVKKGVLKGKNLVLSVPTAAGKTLVAILAAIKKLSENYKVVYIVPLVALANEKFELFKKIFSEKYRVAISVGDLDEADPWLKDYDIIVVTSEKLDSLIRHGAEWIDEVGLIVADEIHLLTQADRGPTLEITLTSLKELAPKAQVLGLSATIKNAEELAKWLNAELVVSDWRPVKLYAGIAYPWQINFIEKEGYGLNKDLPIEAAIAENTLNLRKQALFFVTTRKIAESLAERLSKLIVQKLSRSDKEKLEKLASEIEKVLEIPTKQCKKIAKCIRGGVAFHHAGLLYQQKKLIEDNFRDGLIKIIVATPTLCLHPDTWVVTFDGSKKICDLKKGDLVLTDKGRFKKVISPLESRLRGKLLVIKSFGTLKVKVSPNHRILVVKQIRHKTHYRNGTQKIWWEYIGPKWIKARELYTALQNNKDDKVSFMLLQPLPKMNIKCKEILLKKEESYVCNQYGKTQTYHPATNRTPKKLPLNYEISRLIGIWAAEGSATEGGAIIFDVASYEIDLMNFIVTTIRKYFPKCKISAQELERHRRRIAFYNKKFANWLRRNIGSNAHNKRIPPSILFNTNREVRLGFFHGFLDGDGYIRVKNDDRTRYIQVATVSPSLAYQFQLLLASLGYISSISKGERSEKSFGGKGEIYLVKISGKSFYNLMDELKINLKQEKGNRTYNINKIWKNYLLFKIRKIEEEEYSGKTYNLSVEEDESYSIGFIVHNSYGVNLPAFRVIMRDLKRYYPGIGAVFIPISEVHQMLGRCGRPQWDSFGEGIILTKNEEEAEELIEHYIYGEPEEIKSKLVSESALRMHTLALISNNFCNSEGSLMKFFAKTFFAFQFGDISLVEEKITEILDLLEKWKFIERKKDLIKTTRIGRRVSELYIDPLTAFHFIQCLNRARKKEVQPFSFLQVISNTIEMQPLLSIRTGEFSELNEEIAKRENFIIQEIPKEWDLEFEDFLKSVKTALMFEAWISEATEDQILTKFKVAPGEFYGRRHIADWLVYSLQELTLLLGYKDLLKEIRKLRVRLEYGVKEELIPLIKLKGIGRVRARKLYSSGLTSLQKLREIPLESLSRLIGPKTAILIKEQLGQAKEKKEKQKNL